MTTHSKSRSVVPLWVRALPGDDLHGLTYKLRENFFHGELSERQDWLLDRCFVELEYRARTGARSCLKGCSLCDPPPGWGDWGPIALFPDGDVEPF